MSSSGLISGTVTASAANGGSYSVNLIVSDGISSATQSLTWTVGPVVESVFYATQENTGLTVGTSTGILSGALDPDSLSLSASLISGPSHGTFSLNSNGSLTYTPDTGWFGTDSFQVRASDGSVYSPIVTVTIETEQVLPQTNNDFRAVATGDFNGDGNADFVAANYTTDQVFVFLGNGDGTFQTPSTISVGNGPIALAVGDLGNGADDIVVANSTDGTVTVLLNNGNGSFTTSQTLTVGTDPTALALGDFEGNGQSGLGRGQHRLEHGFDLPQQRQWHLHRRNGVERRLSAQFAGLGRSERGWRCRSGDRQRREQHHLGAAQQWRWHLCLGGQLYRGVEPNCRGGG